MSYVENKDKNQIVADLIDSLKKSLDKVAKEKNL